MDIHLIVVRHQYLYPGWQSHRAPSRACAKILFLHRGFFFCKCINYMLLPVAGLTLSQRSRTREIMVRYLTKFRRREANGASQYALVSCLVLRPVTVLLLPLVQVQYLHESGGRRETENYLKFNAILRRTIGWQVVGPSDCSSSQSAFKQH